MRPSIAFQPSRRLHIAIAALITSTAAWSTLAAASAHGNTDVLNSGANTHHPGPGRDVTIPSISKAEQNSEQKVLLVGVDDDDQTSTAPPSMDSTSPGKSSDHRKKISGFNPPDFELRILALGDSITYGEGSSHGNGYRKYLRDSLRQAGYEVNMVGSKRHGQMNNNEVEARDKSDQITDILQASKQSIKYQPNLIIVNAGTFDALHENDLIERSDRFQQGWPAVGGISRRYDALLDYLFQQEEQKIVLADMVLPGLREGKYEGFLSRDYRSDWIHPNDEGYKKMAEVYLRAIIEAGELRFLSTPRHSEYVDSDVDAGGDDLDIYTVQPQLPAPPLRENVELYMAARSSEMRGMRRMKDDPFPDF
ncbi:SGNH hydrolase-type esterase domain-containing protein [Triangularia verruculosa]|uniref:SGNH hydrolase-type esterase domain-containing protein n=1 Tax=Triangularia verruculosa TaxID=2587418 RepID=A0AAN6XQW8_9PEZI|nr:SGNH hydrolase-type esterase domain-containing protein [Triangularia verruculosa]